jgi:ATP-dependent DNA helicase RecG
MNHPDHIGVPGEVELAIEPVYGLTAGLSLKMMRKAVQAALTRVPPVKAVAGEASLARGH